jgi:autotransporter-associated beta strand protein
VTSAASGSVISVAQLTLTTSGGTHTFEVADGASALDLTISGTINNYFGNESITKTGAGVLALTGSAAAPGGLTISAGTLQIGAGGTTGSVSGAIANNSVLVFNRSDDLTYGSVLSGTGQLSKVGDGILTLTGSNTFSGGTAVSTGTLRVGHLSALGSGSVTVFSGGTLDLANYAVTNVIYFSGGTLINAGSLAGGVTVTGNVSAADINALAVPEVVLGAGATLDLSTVTKDIVVSGNATLQNLASFTGKLAVAGALDLSSAGNRPSGAMIELRAGGTLDFGSSTPFTGSVDYKGGAIQGAFSGTVNVSGTGVALDDANIASGKVVVGTGASVDLSDFTGTVRLTGDGGVTAGLPTFSGTLELGAGSTLNLTTLGGSLDNATVTVDDGATMRGTGTVGDTTLASGGALAPGNSPGSLTYTNLTLQGGASIDFEIANTGGGLYPPVAGSDYDALVVNGLLDISGLSAGNTLTLNLISLIADGSQAGDLGDFDPSGAYAFDLFTYGQISAYEGSISQYFTLDGAALTFNGAPVDMQYWNLVDTGTGIQLQYSPIPEPSTYGLVLGGLALAGAAIRRRRAKRG